MHQRIRSHLTYANVMVTILAFIVLGGGTAIAAVVVSSNSQIGPGTISGHKPPTGKHANIIAGSINGRDVADRSGVDTCTRLAHKYGPICASGDGKSRTWAASAASCASLGMRLPSVGEAITLALNHDVPGVVSSQSFWTDGWFYQGGFVASSVDDFGNLLYGPVSGTNWTVCVTDPSA